MFYVISAVHGLHLLGGLVFVAMLLYQVQVLQCVRRAVGGAGRDLLALSGRAVGGFVRRDAHQVRQRRMRGMMLFAWGLLALAVAAFVFALYARYTATKEPPLPIMGTVDMPFEFKNQWGETITRETFNGKVWVAYFFFTTCPSICPTMNRNAIDVQREFAKKPQVLMAGFTVDPENDTVAQLKSGRTGTARSGANGIS
jgi:hypothetical protein